MDRLFERKAERDLLRDAESLLRDHVLTTPDPRQRAYWERLLSLRLQELCARDRAGGLRDVELFDWVLLKIETLDSDWNKTFY